MIKTKSIPVVQLTKNDEIVKIYDGASIASREFGCNNNISECCNRKAKYCGGYKWIYLKDYKPELSTEEVNYYKNRAIPTCNYTWEKKIVKLSLSGEFIAQYDSILEGAESVGLKTGGNISACCTGRQKTSGGYKWMYLEDYENLKNNS